MRSLLDGVRRSTPSFAAAYPVLLSLIHTTANSDTGSPINLHEPTVPSPLLNAAVKKGGRPACPPEKKRQVHKIYISPSEERSLKDIVYPACKTHFAQIVDAHGNKLDNDENVNASTCIQYMASPQGWLRDITNLGSLTSEVQALRELSEPQDAFAEPLRPGTPEPSHVSPLSPYHTASLSPPPQSSPLRSPSPSASGPHTPSPSDTDISSTPRPAARRNHKVTVELITPYKVDVSKRHPKLSKLHERVAVQQLLGVASHYDEHLGRVDQLKEQLKSREVAEFAKVE